MRVLIVGAGAVGGYLAARLAESGLAVTVLAVGDATVVIPFLNGIGHIAPLVARFGRAAAGGVLRITTDRRSDGTIVVLGPVFEAEIGELDGGASERMQAVAGLLRDAGATVTVSADIVGRTRAGHGHPRRAGDHGRRRGVRAGHRRAGRPARVADRAGVRDDLFAGDRA